MWSATGIWLAKMPGTARAVVLAGCCALLFTMCQKADEINKAILVKVRYDGSPVAQAGIYIRRDTLANPGIPLSRYNYKRGADAAGEAYFDYVSPGKYYLYAQGYSTAAQRTVDGEASLIIEPASPDYREVIIETND